MNLVLYKMNDAEMGEVLGNVGNQIIAYLEKVKMGDGGGQIFQWYTKMGSKRKLT